MRQAAIDERRASSADCDNEIAYAQQMANEYAALIEQQQAEIEQIQAEKEAARIAAEQAAAVADVLKNPDVGYEEKGNLIRSVVEQIIYDKESGKMSFDIIIS